MIFQCKIGNCQDLQPMVIFGRKIEPLMPNNFQCPWSYHYWITLLHFVHYSKIEYATVQICDVARNFFGSPGNLRGITRFPRGVRGRTRHRTVMKFHLFKCIKVLEIHPFFKYIKFFLSEQSIFSRKNLEKLTYFSRITEFVSKNILKLSVLTIPYKSIEISGEFYYIVENFIKQLRNSFDREGLLKMAWNFLKSKEEIDWNL